MKDDQLYKIHIHECIERIHSYCKDVDREQFLSTSLIQDAVLRNLHIMAESTQRLSQKFKDTHKDIEWYKISGLRNIIVHDYLGIDLDIVWNIIHNELPVLKKVIKDSGLQMKEHGSNIDV